MEGKILGSISLIIAGILIYILSSGSKKLTNSERIISTGWIIFLIFLVLKFANKG